MTASGWPSWRRWPTPELVPQVVAEALAAAPSGRRRSTPSPITWKAARRCSSSTTASTWSRPAPNWSRRCCAPARTCRLLATSRETLRVPGEVTWRVPLTLPAQAGSRSARGGVAGGGVGAAVRHPGSAGRARIRARRRQRGRRRLPLPPPRRDAAGDRAGGGAGERPHSGSDRRAPRRLAGPALGRAPHSDDQAADPPGNAAPEARAARGRRAGAAAAWTGRVCRRLRAGGGRGRRRRGSAAARRGRRRARPADRQVAGSRRGGPRRSPLPLLETVRQYAAERLDEAGEREVFERRHRDWYIELAESDPTPAGDLPARDRLRRLDLERDNLRAARLGPGRRSSGRPPPGRRSLAFLAVRGYLAEGYRWLAASLAAAPEHTADRAHALLASCLMGMRRGVHARLHEFGAESITTISRRARRLRRDVRRGRGIDGLPRDRRRSSGHRGAARRA